MAVPIVFLLPACGDKIANEQILEVLKEQNETSVLIITNEDTEDEEWYGAELVDAARNQWEVKILEPVEPYDPKLGGLRSEPLVAIGEGGTGVRILDEILFETAQACGSWPCKPGFKAKCRGNYCKCRPC